MTIATRMLIIAGLIAAAGPAASAQTSQTSPAQTPPAPPSMGFLNINIGANLGSQSVGINQSFPLYNETATVNTSQEVGSAALFDISGGYRVWRNVSAAIGFSRYNKTSDATGTASIPNPLIFNRPATVNISQEGLDHTGRAVHLQASWLFPVTNEFDVRLALGPSIFTVEQELVNSVTVPAGTQNATPNIGSESKTTVGANFQIDGNYLVRRNLGGGVFMRWASRKVDLPSVSDVRVGGFQIGAGARYRF